MKFISAFLCTAFSASVMVNANTLHVPSQYATIQEGLNAAAPGDSVLVAAGTYTENVVWPQTNDLHLLSDPLNATRPIIDGAMAGRVIDIETDGSTVFSAEISGFAVTHGYLNVPAHNGETGSGIFVSNGVLQLSNCVLSDNQVTSTFDIQNSGGGAGLSIVSTPAGYTNRIESCRFTFNSVTHLTNGDGPALHLDGAPALIKNTEISHNRISVSEVALGMIYDFASDITLDGVKIDNNQAVTTQSLPVGFAAIKGTAVFSYLSNVELADSKIANNLATPQNSTLTVLGAAIYFYGEGTTLKVLSSSIAYNQRTDGAATSGTAVFFSSTTARTASVANSILWNPGDGDEIDNFSKPAAVASSDVRNGYRGSSNLGVDPLFVSESDLHLQPASLCINAGNNRLAPARDIDGNTRPLPAGTNTDLGCYEIDQSVAAR
jgi:hypothetical protein